MKEQIKCKLAPQPIGSYSQAIKSDNLVYISGQIALDITGQRIVSSDVVIQTKVVLTNIKSILKEAKLSMEDVIKVMIFLTEMNDFSKINSIYSKFFVAPFPARGVVQVCALPKGAKIEIEAIARIG